MHTGSRLHRVASGYGAAVISGHRARVHRTFWFGWRDGGRRGQLESASQNHEQAVIVGKMKKPFTKQNQESAWEHGTTNYALSAPMQADTHPTGSTLQTHRAAATHSLRGARQGVGPIASLLDTPKILKLKISYQMYNTARSTRRALAFFFFF